MSIECDYRLKVDSTQRFFLKIREHSRLTIQIMLRSVPGRNYSVNDAVLNNAYLPGSVVTDDKGSTQSLVICRAITENGRTADVHTFRPNNLQPEVVKCHMDSDNNYTHLLFVGIFIITSASVSNTRCCINYSIYFLLIEWRSLGLEV